MAKAREAVVSSVPKAIVKLFADLSSPVLVDECGEVKVCLMRKVGGNTVVQGPQVDFAKPWFVEANGGDEFAIDLESTDKLDLQRVLAPRPGRYQAQAYDRNKRAIVRAVVVIEVEPDPAAAEPDEPDEPDDDDDTGDPSDDSAATATVKVLARLVERQIGRGDNKNKEKDSDAVDVLRDEIRRLTSANESLIRDLGNRHEDDLRRLKTEAADTLRALQSKHDNEVASVWLETKTALQGAQTQAAQAVRDAQSKAEEERTEYNHDRREWTAERRGLVERYEARILALQSETSGESRELRMQREGELRELRMQMEQKLHDQTTKADQKLQELTMRSETKIQELQGKLLEAQQVANARQLELQGSLMNLDLRKQLAERDAADSQHVAATIRSQAEQDRIETEKTMRELATRAGNGSSTVGQLIAGIPAATAAFKEVARALKDDSKQLPTDAKQLLAYVAANPGLVEELRKDPTALQQVQAILYPQDDPQGSSPWEEHVPAPAQAQQQQQQPQQQQQQPEPTWAPEPTPQAPSPPPAAVQASPVQVEVVDSEPEPVPPAPAWDGVSRPSVTLDLGAEPVEPVSAPVPDPIPPEAQAQAE